MGLPVYESLIEKEKVFNSENITDAFRLREVISQYSISMNTNNSTNVNENSDSGHDLSITENDNEFDISKKIIEAAIQDYKKRPAKPIYRGIHQAKYKLYNSAQRTWILNKLVSNFNNQDRYNDFICDQIKLTREFQGGVITKWYQTFDHSSEPSDFTILGFLQHYRAATPLIDWSRNFAIALFFAFDGVVHDINSSSESDINNYVSIYEIDQRSVNIIDFYKIADDLTSQLNGIKEKYPNVSTQKLDTTLSKYDYKFFESYKILYLPGPLDTPERSLFHNINIINQEGSFIFSNSPDKPLETIFNGFGKNSWDLPKIKCYNIHKSLKGVVTNYLKKEGLVDDFIYPQEENIGKEVLKQALHIL